MKHFLLVLFIILILLGQYFWYRSRKILTLEQKKIDNNFVSKTDLITLIFLLMGYLFLVYRPYQTTLYGYFCVALMIGLILLFRYNKVLVQQKFPSKFVKRGLLYFAFQYALTTTLGFMLIVIYSLK